MKWKGNKRETSFITVCFYFYGLSMQYHSFTADRKQLEKVSMQKKREKVAELKRGEREREKGKKLSEKKDFSERRPEDR